MAGDERKEVVIIGGGIIGCTSAYFLTHHPSYNPEKHKITLLEATKIAGGASGKAGGLLGLWAYPSSIVPLSYKLHKELADKYNGAERWGYRAVHCGSVDCKGRHIHSKDTVKGKDNEMDGKNETPAKGGAQSVSLEKKKNNPKIVAAGVPSELDWIDPDCLRMYDEMGDPSTTAQVHPFQFTTAMAELSAEKGVDIRVGAAVKSINYTKDGKGVESITYIDKNENNKETTISATDVVISAGPWTKNVYPSAPITATRAHSVTIRPTREISAYCLFTEIKLPVGFGQDPKSIKSHMGGRSQIVSPEIYTRPKNEVYACGEGDHMVPLPKTSDLVEVDEQRCQDIVDYVSSISDELRDGEVTARQACYLPNVQGANGPLIGQTGIKGLLMAAGHTCWGINNGPATGKLISEFVFDGAAKSAKIQGLDPRMVL